MGFTVPPTIKEIIKEKDMGQSPTPKPIEELTENDYRNLFEGCVSIPMKEMPAEATETTLKPFDGFDWDKDMEEAYKTD